MTVDMMPAAQSFFGLAIPSANTIQSRVELAEPIDGCATLRGKEYSRRLVLIRRGGCTFIQKAHKAMKAGALGIIVFDNVDSDTMFNMKADESFPDVHIYSTFITKLYGEKLMTYIQKHNDDLVLGLTLD
jgi:hypothetical protein